MASAYFDDKYDIFSVRAIINRLDRGGHLHIVEERLFARINEGIQ